MDRAVNGWRPIGPKGEQWIEAMEVGDAGIIVRHCIQDRTPGVEHFVANASIELRTGGSEEYFYIASAATGAIAAELGGLTEWARAICDGIMGDVDDMTISRRL